MLHHLEKSFFSLNEWCGDMNLGKSSSKLMIKFSFVYSEIHPVSVVDLITKCGNSGGS